MIFDTHCHLYDEKFNEDIHEIIKRCFENNVGLIMLVGDNIKNSTIASEVSKKYPNIFAAIGVHPMDIESIDFLKLEEEIIALYQTNKQNIKAIGEIGLDYYWDKKEETKIKQKEYFIKQIQIANKLNLPIIIHARDSVEDAIKILKEHPCNNKGVFHCYSGSEEQMKEILKLGFYIGLDGPITYKNAITPKKIAKNIPMDKLLIETDSPYLPPVPNRGKINYPYYLKYVVEEISLLRKIDIKQVEDITYDNGKRLFKI